MNAPIDPPPIPPGTLWAALRGRTRHALETGALQGIETEQQFIDDGGARFLVRSVSSLRRKARAGGEQAPGPGFNPFLPPEPDLTVGALSPTHTAVLNKFNVLDHHLLMVTRDFEHQETLLTREDFAALALCLGEIDGLGFYNGGADAGASQLHKHLQLVPLPLIRGGPDLPLEPPMLDGLGDDGRASFLPYAHRLRRLPPGLFAGPGAADRLLDLYLELLVALGIGAKDTSDGPRQSGPYNLLLRRGWMLLVPRSREQAEGISVNALGYAGSLFVRNAAELEAVRRLGPFRLLREVGRPAG